MVRSVSSLQTTVLSDLCLVSCAYRARPITRGPDVHNIVPPMEWAHHDYTVSIKPVAVGLTEEEYLELHKILSLEKFIPFSKSVLECT